MDHENCHLKPCYDCQLEEQIQYYIDDGYSRSIAEELAPANLTSVLLGKQLTILNQLQERITT